MYLQIIRTNYTESFKYGVCVTKNHYYISRFDIDTPRNSAMFVNQNFCHQALNVTKLCCERQTLENVLTLSYGLGMYLRVKITHNPFASLIYSSYRNNNLTYILLSPGNQKALVESQCSNRTNVLRSFIRKSLLACFQGYLDFANNR